MLGHFFGLRHTKHLSQYSNFILDNIFYKTSSYCRWNSRCIIRHNAGPIILEELQDTEDILQSTLIDRLSPDFVKAFSQPGTNKTACHLLSNLFDSLSNG